MWDSGTCSYLSRDLGRRVLPSVSVWVWVPGRGRENPCFEHRRLQISDRPKLKLQGKSQILRFEKRKSRLQPRVFRTTIPILILQRQKMDTPPSASPPPTNPQPQPQQPPSQSQQPSTTSTPAPTSPPRTYQKRGLPPTFSSTYPHGHISGHARTAPQQAALLARKAEILRTMGSREEIERAYEEVVERIREEVEAGERKGREVEGEMERLRMEREMERRVWGKLRGLKGGGG